ncbi:MAG: arginine deiminase family protein [Desulfocapsaceae bacterium]|jgi:dimethylargininase|nr:arginine deiminase family protein [Desulfocapsaceae bacterium]
MLTVVTHLPSPALQDCELTFLESEPINIVRATEQHERYCSMIEACGARVVRLDGNLSLPDSVFVEDPVIVFDEVAVIASMGVASRRREGALLAEFFSTYREIRRLSLPAQIEGGDVLKIGHRVYVGESRRTNRQGLEALKKIIEPFGYETIPVTVTGCLHLKTGCTALDHETILINPAWVDSAPFDGFRKIETPAGEPFAANVLPIHDTVCMNDAFPETISLVSSLGYTVMSTDISEFMKAEAGLTCMCVPFRSASD